MIKSQITLKQLEAFAFVVDTGTFRAAAAALGTTQPNISARIAALETTLGAALLTRDAGSVRLTESGAILLKKTRQVLWAAEALIEDAARQDLIEERLRLGVTELVACTWLQGFLRRVRQTYPNLRVELEVDLSTVIDDRLSQGQLDLALHNGPFKTDLDGTIRLGQEGYVWAANPEIAQQLGGSKDVQRFFGHQVLTHAKHTQAVRALHDMARQSGLDQGQIVHSSALSACVPMVCEGLGVALLPKSLIHQELASGQLRFLRADWLPSPLVFFARHRKQRSALYVAKVAQMAGKAMVSHLHDLDVK